MKEPTLHLVLECISEDVPNIDHLHYGLTAGNPGGGLMTLAQTDGEFASGGCTIGHFDIKIPDLLNALAAESLTEEQRQKIHEHFAPASPPYLHLGVGDGTGQLFVHGPYEAIKACQKKLLELETKRQQVEQLEKLSQQLYTALADLCSQVDDIDLCSAPDYAQKALINARQIGVIKGTG